MCETISLPGHPTNTGAHCKASIVGVSNHREAFLFSLPSVIGPGVILELSKPLPLLLFMSQKEHCA